MYLTYFYFDEKKYKDFLIHYKNVDFDYFSKNLKQEWRELQHRQLKIASKVYLGLYDKINEEITSFIDYRDSLADINRIFSDTLFYAIIEKNKDFPSKIYVSKINMELLEKIVEEEGVMLESFDILKNLYNPPDGPR